MYPLKFSNQKFLRIAHNLIFVIVQIIKTSTMRATCPF
jgi:hypothetical protein